MSVTTADKLASKCVELEKLFTAVNLVQAERNVLMAMLELENLKKMENK